MKNSYLLILTLFISQLSLAQITLTSTTSTPVVGDQYTMITFTSLGGMRPAGPNQTWNFSGATSSGPLSYGYVTKSSLSEASYFPQSNLADTFNLMYQSYSVISSSSWASEGTALPPLNRTVYTDKREWIDFPITYNNSFSETFAGTVTTFFPSSTMNRSGTIQIKSDDYGSVIFPYETVNNVLRVRNISTYTEVSGSTTDSYVDTTYSWYHLNNRNPIATYQIQYKNGSLNFAGGGYIDQADIVLGINDIDKSNLLTIYPNPVVDVVTISLEKQALIGSYYQLMDNQGKMMKTEQLHTTKSTVNLSNYAKGIYFLSVLDLQNNKLKTYKIIKQ